MANSRVGKKHYTIEPGRQIYHDGKPFIGISRAEDTAPAEADLTARRIVVLLNQANHPRRHRR